MDTDEFVGYATGIRAVNTKGEAVRHFLMLEGSGFAAYSFSMRRFPVAKEN